jgi:amidase
MNDKTIIGLTALELSGLIKTKEVSCVEVMQAHLSHIDAVNPAVNAIVARQDSSLLMKQAADKDADLAQGHYDGWMHGFPHAVKDLASTKGITTTLGSPILKDNIPTFDQLIVERMKKAGIIVIGKTNVPEFGLGCQSYNKVYGTTGNAYDPTKTSGGSSGGAAVALATRMVPVADGSDMAGSLRNPASFNNVVGFRASFGSVPYYPAQDVWSAPMGIEGAMGRTVNDVAMLHATLAGYDSRYPLSISQDTSCFTEPLKRDFKGSKIGWLGDLDGYLPMEDGIMDMCREALKYFEAMGCEVENARPKSNPVDAWEAWLILRNFQVGGMLADFYKDKAKRTLMKPEAQSEVEGLFARSAEDIYRGTKLRTNWYQAVDKLFDDFDFLVLPGAQVFPFDKETNWLKSIKDTHMETYHQWMAVYCFVTLTGCPVINMPVGFNADGLPLGLQIIARNKADLDVLQMGYAFEEASGHIARKTPAILSR